MRVQIANEAWNREKLLRNGATFPSARHHLNLQQICHGKRDWMYVTHSYAFATPYTDNSRALRSLWNYRTSQRNQPRSFRSLEPRCILQLYVNHPIFPDRLFQLTYPQAQESATNTITASAYRIINLLTHRTCFQRRRQHELQEMRMASWRIC